MAGARVHLAGQAGDHAGHHEGRGRLEVPDRVQRGRGRELLDDDLRQPHPQEGERAQKAGPVQNLLDGEEPLVRPEASPVRP
jgi:hypothetical protein